MRAPVLVETCTRANADVLVADGGLVQQNDLLFLLSSCCDDRRSELGWPCTLSRVVGPVTFCHSLGVRRLAAELMACGEGEESCENVRWCFSCDMRAAYARAGVTDVSCFFGLLRWLSSSSPF